MKKAFICLIFLFGFWAEGFPDLTRHGYTHCTACHTSLTGGGLLNSYGRALSRELVSQKSLKGRAAVEGDEAAFFGLLPNSERLLLGGDLRVLQLFVESEQASRGRFFVMQLDFDSSYQWTNRIRSFFSVGRFEPQKADAGAQDFIGFPRYGVELLLTSPDGDSRATLRMGRFMPVFGINFAEHTFVNRSRLSFGPGQERLAAELAWIDEKTSLVLTGVNAQFSMNDQLSETGGTIQLSRQVGEKSKIGINYYQTKRKNDTLEWSQKTSGLFAHWHLSDRWFVLTEIDQYEGEAKTRGFLEITKLGYELWQGLQFFAVHEFANPNTRHANPKFEGYSIGLNWFPRPHYEVYTLYRHERDTAVSSNFQDVVWLLGHLYF